MVNAPAEPSVPAHPPIIDISSSRSKEEIAADIMDAGKNVGFFYITNHGISEKLIADAFAIYEKFCDQPTEAKMALPRVNWGEDKILGYEINHVADGLVRESHIQVFDVHEKAATAWPDEKLVPGYKETTRAFMNAMPPVVDKIMSCIAIGLGFPEDFFKDTTDVKYTDNETFIQYHKYPSVENMKLKPGNMRISAHTDESIITLLLTGPGSTGLEVAAGKDGKAVDSESGFYQVERWNPCPPLPGCISVNIGDPLQFWSDGLLKSNYHRVRPPMEGESKAARYSIGYFVWPRLHTVIEGPKKKYPATTMAEFMKVKGKLYATGFNADAEQYEKHQHLAFGVPEAAAAVAV